MRNLTVTLLGLMLACNAYATSHRTFVSADGTDSGICGPTTPCRTLTYALSQTNDAGEIVITKSGGYGDASGGLVIDKSISIIAEPGVFAALAPTSGNGITISTAFINVTVRGLNINGRGGNHGIYMTNSFNASLTVIDSNISGFGYTATWPGDTGGAGIYVNTQAKVTITGTILRYNGYGIRVAGGAQAVVSRVQAIMNGVGVAAIGPATDTTASSTSLSVSDSLATQGYMGFGAVGRTFCSLCSTSVQVSNSIASQNVYGINSEAPGATLYASGNRIDKNSIGMSQFSTATFNSAGNNVTINNSTNTANTITSVAGSVFH